MPRLFVSDAVTADRLRLDQPAAPWQGWGALSASYQASFAAAGWACTPLLRPEIYQTEQARAALGVQAGDWHLAVKPTEHLRPFHGLPNLFVCDWPFPELSHAVCGGLPFFDQARLLRQAQAVLCPTAATTEVLHNAGIERAVTLPPHLPLAPNQPAGTPTRFLCVAEAGWLARQLGPAIEGFALAAAKAPQPIQLTVVVDGDGPDLAAVRQRAAAAGVTVTAGPARMADADVFLCCHAAAGLHLPLAEAMLAGVPAVTTLGAGTGSWVPPGAAVPIATSPDLLDGDGEPIGQFMPLTSHPATAASVRDAVLAMLHMAPAARQHMADTARQAAGQRFSLAAFQAGLARVQELLG